MCASNILVLILPIITLPLVSLGKLLLKWRTWNWTFSLILINICSSTKGSGEVAMIIHQCTRSNAPGMQNCNASKHNSYIMYLDAKNLYGWAMSPTLLTFKFLMAHRRGNERTRREDYTWWYFKGIYFRVWFGWLLFLLSLYSCIFHKV